MGSLNKNSAGIHTSNHAINLTKSSSYLPRFHHSTPQRQYLVYINIVVTINITLISHLQLSPLRIISTTVAILHSMWSKFMFNPEMHAWFQSVSQIYECVR